MRSGTARLDRFGRLSVRVTLMLGLAACLPAWPAAAQSAQTSTPAGIDIPAGDLAGALDRLSRQAGIQLMYQPALVAGKQAKALSGRLTWQAALGRLLQGSGLEYHQVNATTVVIRRSEEGAKPSARPAAPPPPQPTEGEETPVTDMKGMTVTGTRIRGGTTTSPVIVIGSENIREEGFTDLGEVIRSVPQNFNGGQNPGVFMGNVTGGGLANQNVTGGSGLNLRGLGPDASLTLLNGHRMSYGGFVQAVDISAIPVEAVERIDIVADGASAIYGSDAVGGVGNVVLKRDYDGVALGGRFGTAADGGLTTHEYNVTAGTIWRNGGLIATYKDVSTDPIYARQRDYTDQLAEPSTIYPGSNLRSGLISAHQSLGDAIEFRLDGLRTKRDQTYYYYYGSLASYQHMAPKTTTTFVAPSIEFFLPNEWSLTAGGSWGKDERVLQQSAVTVTTGNVRLTTYNCRCNQIRAYELGSEGPLFKLPAGDMRLAVGAGWRRNKYSDLNYLTSIPNAVGAESVRFAYGELNIPLIGDESSSASTPRLAVTAAARVEDYDSFGSVRTPKLGITYAPNSDFTLKASWGRSFKAPTLYQRYYASSGSVIDPALYGGKGFPADKSLFILGGGVRDLEPERARTSSVSIAYHPEAIPRLETELTWFDINYVDRVVQPINNYNEALSNPIYAEFVDWAPTPEKLAKLLGEVDNFFNYTANPYDPSKVIAILDARYVNATQQRIKGADLSGSYRFDMGGGQLTMRGSASWIQSTQRTAGTPYDYDLAGTLSNPAKFNGRVGAVFSKGGLVASVFATYIGGVTNTSNGVKSASFTTFDAVLRYSTEGLGGAWSGLDFALSVNNVFNRAPPLYVPVAPLYVAPYDSTNYSSIGRFVNLSVSKHW